MAAPVDAHVWTCALFCYFLMLQQVNKAGFITPYGLCFAAIPARAACESPDSGKQAQSSSRRNAVAESNRSGGRLLMFHHFLVQGAVAPRTMVIKGRLAEGLLILLRQGN
jgi:hypothetical protein